MSAKTIAIIAGVVLVLLIGALFWFSGQANNHKPPTERLSVPATNVGPQSAAPGGTGNAPQ
jgi:hypothetical protein